MQKPLNWNTIYKEYSPKLLGICRRYVQDLAAAEDILQDSFISAIEKQNQLKENKALFGWMKTIVVNNALQYLKKNGEKYFNEFKEENFDVNDEQDDGDFLTKKYPAEKMLACIDQLSPHQKTVFNLFFLENYSHEDIAKELQININTSKSHLLRAKKNIKTQLMQQQEPSYIKKKGIQLLVFLGFANLLWAKNLQDTFADFSIPPKKELPREFQEILVINSGNVSKRSSFNKKMIMTLFVFVGLCFFVWSSRPFHQEKPIAKTEVKSEKIINQTPKITSSEISKIKTVEEKPIPKTPKKENLAKKVQKEPTEKTEKPSIKSDENLALNNDVEKTPKEITKTTADNKNLEKLDVSSASLIEKETEKPKRVVIVKKIIQRDTVYIKK